MDDRKPLEWVPALEVDGMLYVPAGAWREQAARIAELETALRPFADAAVRNPCGRDNRGYPVGMIHLRHACKVLGLEDGNAWQMSNVEFKRRAAAAMGSNIKPEIDDDGR